MIPRLSSPHPARIPPSLSADAPFPGSLEKLEHRESCPRPLAGRRPRGPCCWVRQPPALEGRPQRGPSCPQLCPSASPPVTILSPLFFHLNNKPKQNQKQLLKSSSPSADLKIPRKICLCRVSRFSFLPAPLLPGPRAGLVVSPQASYWLGSRALL